MRSYGNGGAIHFLILSPLIANITELEGVQFSHNFLVTDISVLAGKEKLRQC